MTPRPSASRRDHVDAAVRRGIFAALKIRGISEMILMSVYVTGEGYGNVSDALEGVERRYQLRDGLLKQRFAASRDRLASRATEDDWTVITDRERMNAAVMPELAIEFLLLLPEPEFLTSLEHANTEYRAAAQTSPRRRGRRESPAADLLLADVEPVLRAHGLPWRVEGASIEWVGERAIHDATIQPAFEALEHPQLADARAAYDQARWLRRQGNPKALEASCVESAKAVEATMKALLVAHGVALPKQANATPLWNRLVEQSIMSSMWQAAILAASGPRNKFAHPTGEIATESDAEYTLAAAGLAIRMLSRAWP